MSRLFSEAEEKAIVDAIAGAELNTSGEIRLHVSKTCQGDPMKKAIAVFEELGMTATKERNGVLIYLAYDDKKFAIIGDQGINDKVPADFWNTVADEMRKAFSQGQIAAGLVKGIEEAGEKLKTWFPYQSDDQNELSNDISFEN